MPTATHTATHHASDSRRATAKSRSRAAPDAIKLLKADHAAVKKLFKDFAAASGAHKQSVIANAICDALTVHTRVEEELFYPAARAALEEEDMLDEADVEHQSAKILIKQIQNGQPGDDKWQAKVKVLSEYITHHVKEEEGELFPALRDTDMDFKALGEQMAARKQQLKSA